MASISYPLAVALDNPGGQDLLTTVLDIEFENQRYQAIDSQYFNAGFVVRDPISNQATQDVLYGSLRYVIKNLSNQIDGQVFK